MRFAKFAVFYPPLLAGLVFGRPLHYPRTAALPAVRDLLGILGGDVNVTPIGGANAIHPATPTTAPTTTTPAAPAMTTNGETHGTRPNLNTAAASNIPGSPSNLGTAAAASALTTRMIGSVMPSSPQPDPAATATFPSASVDPGYVSDASRTPPAELTEWKVIGIAVITITFIATVILSVTFFDQWWGFVSAALCGRRAKKKGEYGETMVPDWKKRSWEFRLASEDGHRYPTMESLESIVKEKDLERPQVQGGGLEGRREVLGARGLTSPEMGNRCM